MINFWLGAGFINVCGETRRLSHSVSDLSIGLHRVEKMGVIDVINAIEWVVQFVSKDSFCTQ